MIGGTTDTARANDAENSPGLGSHTVRVVGHELVGHADPRQSGATTTDGLDAEFYVNEPVSGNPGLIGVSCHFHSNSNALVKSSTPWFDVVR